MHSIRRCPVDDGEGDQVGHRISRDASWVMARGGLWPACARELERPHWYTSKQYCGAVPYDAELARLRKAIAGASRLTASRRAELEKEAAAFEARLVYRRARL